MRNHLTPLCIFLFLSINASAQFVTIPDNTFRNYLKSLSYNAVEGNQLDTTDFVIQSYKHIVLEDTSLHNIEGIEYLHGLEELTIRKIDAPLPVLPAQLKRLHIEDKNIDTLFLTAASLEYLYINNAVHY